MANEQKISKWWLWAFPALANLFLLVVYIVFLATPVGAAKYALMRVVEVFYYLIYEPIRSASGLTHRQFYSRSSIVLIWELMAFAGGLLCYAVGLLCHNVAAMRRRAPNGEGQQPGDRGEAREPEKGGAGSGTEKETGGNE